MTRRLIPALSAGCALAIGLTAWTRLRAGGTDVDVPASAAPTTATADAPDLRQQLQRARRSCAVEPLDEVIAQLERRTHASERAADWRLLAEALLERVQQRNHLLGMAVGRPMCDELPAEQAADVDAGLAAVARARQLGDDSGELYRIEAGLLSQRITGLATALQWNGRIGAALQAAGDRDEQRAPLHVALGLRKLLAPRLLGHDPDKALEHFEFAAKAGDDERPAVFAAMACLLLERRQAAIAWLEQAVERNPANGFARVVLARVRRGEPDPFGRDVSAAEVAATTK